MTNQDNSLYMTMSLRYLDNQLKQLGKYQYPRDQALKVLGLSDWDFKNLETRIDVGLVETMYQDASETLNEPFIGLRAGHDFRVTTFGKTGSLYTYCENLAQVFKMNRLYQRLSVDVGDSEYVIEDGRHFFVFHTYPEAEGISHILGMIFGAHATAFRWLSWSTGRDLKAVTLTRPAPENPHVYEDAVKCPLEFSAARNCVELYPETMAAKLPTYNPEKLAAMTSILDRMLENKISVDSFQSAVRASLRAAISNGSVSLGIIAKRLDMPERKLRRVLSMNGLSYRALLDAERQGLFKELHDHGMSFAQISQSLAYNDQAAFNRAFRRWYGVAPGAYKADA